MSQPVIAYVTCPSDEEARALARTLVEEGLAACCTLAPVRSIYRWQGELCEEAEVQLLLKTERARLPALEARVRALHSYEVPELLAVDVVWGSLPYLDWLRAGLAP